MSTAAQAVANAINALAEAHAKNEAAKAAGKHAMYTPSMKVNDLVTALEVFLQQAKQK
jgi:hypothetical protein